MILSLVLAVGCTPSTGEAPEQLQALEAAHDGADSMAAIDAAGVASVEGSAHDWSLVVGAGVDAVAMEIHAPGSSDLSGLDGLELTVDLGDAWGDDVRTVRIADADGPVFLAQDGGAFGPATDAFGDDFAALGDELATGSVDSDYGAFTLSYRTGLFRSDDGEVEVLPGEPAEVSLDGTPWRLVLHAAYEVTDSPDTLPGCGGGIGTTLSFEMIRIDEEVELERVAPVTGRHKAGYSTCG